METVKRFQEKALRKIEPRVVVREFELCLTERWLVPIFVCWERMFPPCCPTVGRLFCWRQRWARRANACSFGNESRSAADALILDAVLSAAVEAVCDEQEERLRSEFVRTELF